MYAVSSKFILQHGNFSLFNLAYHYLPAAPCLLILHTMLCSSTQTHTHVFFNWFIFIPLGAKLFENCCTSIFTFHYHSTSSIIAVPFTVWLCFCGRQNLCVPTTLGAQIMALHAEVPVSLCLCVCLSLFSRVVVDQCMRPRMLLYAEQWC